MAYGHLDKQTERQQTAREADRQKEIAPDTAETGRYRQTATQQTPDGQNRQIVTRHIQGSDRHADIHRKTTTQTYRTNTTKETPIIKKHNDTAGHTQTQTGRQGNREHGSHGTHIQTATQNPETQKDK